MRRLLVVASLVGLAACGSYNMVEAPRPAEADPQFILERKMSDQSGNTPSVYVIRDKVNNKLIYVTPGAGIAVEDE